MTLPSSGPMSIEAMRIEYGLGHPVAMNQFYGKNGLPSSGGMRFGDFYGKSNYLDQQIVTVGKKSNFGFDQWGFQTGTGSIADGTSNIYGGISITKLYWDAFSGRIAVYFEVASSVSNAGWTTMVINGTSFARSSATEFTNNRNWRFNTNSNPFGTTVGAQITVTWY